MDHRESGRPRDFSREDEADDHYLPTLSIVHLPHHKIPNLYQRCFEYVEPWQWSPVTELVETGQWFFAQAEAKPNPSPDETSRRAADGRSTSAHGPEPESKGTGGSQSRDE